MGFQPLREVLQRRVHRLVYGDRADPYAALARLGQRLQSVPDPSEVFTAIVDDVAGALRLGYCAVSLRRGDALEVAAEQGSPGREPQFVVPLAYQGDEIGELIAEPAPRSALSSTDRQLLGDLARQAGAAAHSVRVMSELQRSRERLIAAREEERLRLRRDLHDGLGPTLAALVFKIGLIRDSVRDDPERSDRLLRELGGETKDAIADIRSLVYALRPPALDELGLVGALREQAALLSESTGLEIAFASPDLPALPPAVEVAAYRIVTEALINVDAARPGGPLRGRAAPGRRASTSTCPTTASGSPRRPPRRRACDPCASAPTSSEAASPPAAARPAGRASTSGFRSHHEREPARARRRRPPALPAGTQRGAGRDAGDRGRRRSRRRRRGRASWRSSWNRTSC